MRLAVRIFAYAGLATGLAICVWMAVVQKTAIGTNGALGLACLIVLALMAARDISQFVAQRTMDFVFNDEGIGVRNPEYEEIEEIWKSGDYLEAIRRLRAYYQKYPTEIYALLRIAEIYENNLNNLLAAALEYEDILKKKLPPERWGWAAIHLCNLYNKLNEPEKYNTLLQRIATEYSQTTAARKARQKLGWPEPEPEPQPQEAPPAPAEPAKKEAQKPSLPPGFRPLE